MLRYYKSTKKALKESIGEEFMPVETSIFGSEYKGDGSYTVVGPDPETSRKMTPKALKLGDRVVIKEYNNIRSIEIVIKITATTAKSNSYTFDKDIRGDGYVKIKGQGKWNVLSGQIENKELIKEIEDTKLNRWIRDNWMKFSPEKIKKIKQIINE